MSENRINEKKISVRKQKVKKNHIREKLIFFTALTVILLIIAVFARKLCPYDPYAQDLLQAQKAPSAEHILGTDRYGRDMFSRVLVGSTTSIYATLLLVAIVTVVGTVIGLWLVWWNRRYASDAYFRFVSGISKPCICTGCCRSSWRWHS